MTILSLWVLLSFLVAGALFLLLARLLARDPATEGWFAAIGVVGISSALLLILEDWGILLERTPVLIHLGFVALTLLWIELRRTTGVLGGVTPASAHPEGRWWVVGLPVGGAALSAVAMVGAMSLPAGAVGGLQAGAIAAAWLVTAWRARGETRPVVAPPSRPGADVFVCYRREDSADIVGRIYDHLTARFGREHVFKDVDSIPLGIDFRTHIAQMVSGCDAVVVVIGDGWMATGPRGARRLDDPEDFVRVEIEAALQREIPVIPVLVRGAAIPAARDLPPSVAPLAYRNGLAVRPDPDFHHDMDRLIEGLERQLASS